VPRDPLSPTPAAGVTIDRSGRRVGAARLRALAAELLDASELCAIATASRTAKPHVNTAYFAWTADLRLVWISDPGASHSRNLRANASAAVAVYDSGQSWGEPDRGIQLFGTARELAGAPADDAAAVYARRFAAYRPEQLAAYRCYELRPRRVKLFHEPALGPRVFVTARVDQKGALIWERTEVYRQ
jgi:uncharacterized protein YhbP (UPF0306 family)